MEKYISKVKVLVEALPYFKEFSGKTLVIKYGGSAMIDDAIKAKVIEDIVLLKYIGINPVIVHGGGKEISTLLNQLGKEVEFINGYRVTDEETMDIAEMVLSGKVGKSIVRHLYVHGVNAVGISGKDGGMFTCKRKLINDQDMGLVGEITKVNPKLINTLLGDGFIPIISPVGVDEEGNTYNINGDNAASAIASALQAEKLVFMTDVPGLLENKEDEESLIGSISIDEIEQILTLGKIGEGMIPKLKCCREAIQKGVNKVHILDGRIEHSLLLEVFTPEGIGTMINR